MTRPQRIALPDHVSIVWKGPPPRLLHSSTPAGDSQLQYSRQCCPRPSKASLKRPTVATELGIRQSRQMWWASSSRWLSAGAHSVSAGSLTGPLLQRAHCRTQRSRRGSWCRLAISQLGLQEFWSSKSAPWRQQPSA